MITKRLICLSFIFPLCTIVLPTGTAASASFSCNDSGITATVNRDGEQNEVFNKITTISGIGMKEMKDTAFTLQNLRHFGRFRIVHIASLGKKCPNAINTSYFISGQKAQDTSNVDVWKNEFRDEYEWWDNGMIVPDPISGNWGVLPKFINEKCDYFDSTIVILSSWYGMTYPAMYDAFLRKGATSVVGWRGCPDTGFARKAISYFISLLADSGKNVTNACSGVNTYMMNQTGQKDSLVYRGAGTLTFPVCCGNWNRDTIFVDSSATGTNNGSSWTNAFTDLQKALSCAHDNSVIRIAKGTYFPHTTNRTKSFNVKRNAKLLGGYSRGGISHDYASNKTILSGDIQKDRDSSNNSYNILKAIEPYSTCLIDGLTITGAFGGSRGGGLITDGSPTISNCTFAKNICDSTGICYGGAIYGIWDGGLSTIKNCMFFGNGCYGDSVSGGGALSIQKGMICNCIFSNNHCKSRNAYSHGGAVNMKGGNVFNCTFSGNRCIGNGYGGALSIYDTSFIANSIFWEDSAQSHPEIHCGSMINIPSSIKHCIIKGKLQCPCETGNNIDSNPLFVSALNQDLHLQSKSAAIDRGIMLTLAGIDLSSDLDGKRRNDGKWDFGAFEFQGTIPNAPSGIRLPIKHR